MQSSTGGSPMKAMILAAGRGERMRPLSDACPKPLLEVGGKALIFWQLERLVRAGWRDVVVNVSYLGASIEAALGDGARFGARITYSREPQPLEVGGGIATAREHLGTGAALVVSADVYCDYDYASLGARAEAIASGESARAHLVMAPNPPYHPFGDFALRGDAITLDDGDRLTFANIALYDMTLFSDLPQGRKLKMLPLFVDWIRKRWVSGERFDGTWANVGTPADLAELNASHARN